jgi:hypothetical protein
MKHQKKMDNDGAKLILQSQFDIKSAELELFAKTHNLNTQKSTPTNSLELHIADLKKKHRELLEKFKVKPVLINGGYGGFGFSDFFIKNYPLYNEDEFNDLRYQRNDKRTNSKLIQFVQEHGLKKCSGKYSNLNIQYIPICTKYEITEYDGLETIKIHPFDLYLQ